MIKMWRPSYKHNLKDAINGATVFDRRTDPKTLVYRSVLQKDSW